MVPLLEHKTLRAVLKGIEVKFNNTTVVHYRGIPYGKIPRRFAKAESLDDWSGEILDCTRFGPQCPQNHVDAGILLRIPENLHEPAEKFEEDELRCLNINVSIPASWCAGDTLLPVLIWIYGGSQVVSFPPLAHKCSDTTPLVAHSIIMGKPMIIVTFNYRLNIFGFGNETEKNLALKDQRLAIQWVVKYIAGFGGDRKRLTLGGESAGAVYTHAHLCTGSPVRRGILQSGSLYLSTPQPLERGTNLIASLSKAINEKYQISLSDAPVSTLLQQLKDDKINTLWIQLEADLLHWEDQLGQIEELLIGDVEYESIIWRNGLEGVSAEEITAAFDSEVEYSKDLKHFYGISPTRDTASKLGALDFINDVRFALPASNIARVRRPSNKTWQYLLDQPNPWQVSSRAHHGVDLIFLFGGYDISFDPAGDYVGRAMRDAWIKFLHNEAPWDEKKRFAFGPIGRCGEINDEEYRARRRVRHFQLLQNMDPGKLMALSGKLAVGRISLLN